MSSLTLLTILTALLVDRHKATDDIVSHLTRKTCMGELGCFSAAFPFFDIVHRPISLLPDERKDINTTFLLYTPFNLEFPVMFSNLDGSVKDLMRSRFNPQMNTSFIVPGYMSSFATEWKKSLVDTLLQTSGNNVFLVDWSDGEGPIYEEAVANTRVVGAEIALFIQKLQKEVGIKPESVHLIGHSLGSHISGYAGKRLKNLGRITALDPGGPYFINVDPVVRLDRGDALFVDAIHTDAGATVFEGCGLTESIGHFDFHPNGGHLQPGCLSMGRAIWLFLLHPSFEAEGFKELQCNHFRAIYLFLSSITSKCDLMGVQCDSWENFVEGKCGSCDGSNGSSCVPLGMHADQYTDRIKSSMSLNFYLNTTATPPYCIVH